MEAIKEYSFTIILLYMIIGVIIFFLSVLWHVIFSGIAYFLLSVFWINLATETYPVYTVLYVVIVIILSVLSQKRHKKRLKIA